MGLLQKLSDTEVVAEKKPAALVEDKKVIQKKSNTVGLLKKSLNVSTDDSLDFFEFIKKYSIQYAAFLTRVNNFYYAEYSSGLDGKSIINSVSTVDFWDGIFKNNPEHQRFTNDDNSITTFYQFFSSQLKEKITSLDIFKYDNGILIVCNKKAFSINEIILPEINYLSSFAKPETQLNFTEAIDSFILSSDKAMYKQQLSKALANALYIKLVIGLDKICDLNFVSDGVYNITVKNKTELPFELLSTHLKFDCSYLLEKNSELLTITEL